MTTPFPFVAGTVLTAAKLNAITTLPINDQTANYTLVVGDVGKRVIMNVASANTVTVNDSIFAAGDTIFIANKGAGVSTITAGAGVTINTSGSLALAQYGGGTLIALSASTFTFFPAGGVSTLDVEFLLVGGGGGGGGGNTASFAGGGGGGGGFVTGSGIIGKDTYTVKVGAAGAGSIAPNLGQNGTTSSFISSANGGGGGASTDDSARNGQNGASGGGGARNSSGLGGAGVSGEGNAGAAAGGFTSAGGGGGAGGAGSGTSGGAASTNNYTGSTISYSGGGGGANSGTAGTNAGAGGNASAGGNGVANRGGGGGGGGINNVGGNGGSGQVVIRYLTADAAAFTITATGATSATPTISGSYSYFEYNGSGTLVVA